MVKWYRPHQCAHTVKNPMVCDISNFEKYDYFGECDILVHHCFFKGKMLSNWPDDVYIAIEKAENDGEPDDVLQNGYMVPIFSGRLVKTIKEAGIKGFQFLPIAVRNFQGECVGEFYVANCVTAIDAFDYERSIYSYFSDDFINPNASGKIVTLKYVLHKEALSEEILKDYEVFCLEGQPHTVFVSERFVKLFRKKKYTGYDFSKVEVI